RLAVTVLGAMLVMANESARADSQWSLEFESPVWTCLVKCSGSPPPGELRACPQTCGVEHYDGTSSPEAAAERLRCRASLMRLEAAQFSCHSHCLSDDGCATDLAGCIDSCNDRYDSRVSRVLGTTRCTGMRAHR